MTALRILLLADTHLGFDDATRPRVQRRRRGPDFFRNFELALEPARRGEVDLVVHGGDLLFRSRVPAGLVVRAFEPLRTVAEAGVPVVVVPGNHERSHLARPLIADHRRLYVLNRPQTVRLDLRGRQVAISGFPFDRHVRRRFPELLAATNWNTHPADLRVLLFHQAVEGARVALGNQTDRDYTFRHAQDVVRSADLPVGFAAVLTGHIHRHQVLTHDLAGRPMASPVLYPGSVERTSFAERSDAKGYLVLEFADDGGPGGRLDRWTFHRLPARPMVQMSVSATALDDLRLRAAIRSVLGELPDDAVVYLKVEGEIEASARSALQATSLRSLHPATMNLTLRGVTRSHEHQR